MKFILSAELSNLSEKINRQRGLQLFKALKYHGFDFRAAEGCYKGSKEFSFMVWVDTPEQASIIKRLAFNVYKQEAILVISDKNECSLLFNDRKTLDYIGMWTEVSEEEARACEAFTALFRPNSMKQDYYIAK